MRSSRPKFQAIVQFARRHIHNGAWNVGQRAPSENELSEQFGVSRMTARRALDVALQINLDKTLWLTRETFTAQAAPFSRC